MKKITIALFVLGLLLSSCHRKKPLDYYNTAVGAGNTSLGFHEMEQRIERLESGMSLPPLDLINRVQMRVPYNEKVLNDLRNLVGNEASDPMIKATMAYLAFDIECSKSREVTKVFELVGGATTFEELRAKLEPMGDYLDSIYDIREELWATYDLEVSRYAKNNDIEMKFY